MAVLQDVGAAAGIVCLIDLVVFEYVVGRRWRREKR